MSDPKTSAERLAEAKAAYRKESEYHREMNEPYHGSSHTIDTSPGSRFRRHNPFYDDGEAHENTD